MGDRWILASSNHLIQFVRAEMAAYRLYTVVPELLKFLDNLTNWYVRMNRRRLKGDGGPEDCGHALATLYTILMTAVHLMAPFTPFMAELLYQRLSQLLPEAERQESVHYCMLPEADDRLLDEDIERKVDRLQKVIDLTRVLRDRNNIPLKMPIAKLIVLHPSQAYLDDLTELQGYVLEELNCLAVEFTTAEENYVSLSAEPNLAVLGKRLKGEAKAIAAQIRALAPDAIRGLISSGTLELAGHTFTTDDIKVVRNFKSDIQNYDTNTNGEALVLMDTRADDTLLQMGLAREFVNRVQKLRKSAGLQPTDRIKVYYDNVEADAMVTAALETQATYVTDNLRTEWFNMAQHTPAGKEVGRTETDLNQKKLTLVFTEA
eukprot:NODE_621_length_1260_cov_43.581338_g448_i0.p1 GENE.NODE_621_length_1260_cov_43.581338_g448_i0~~NODE_621_length_1260_cov_43.581338_g448_i0.p1  ORF type:complete len:385 (+),score=200.94 NODE_621_length_1260_cov_43.581338_g448_i0:29-1156(+)